MLAQGFIVHRVGMMPLSKVTDLAFQRSLRGRLLGYGTVFIESAGQIQALNRIDYIPRPEEVYEALSELIFGEKAGHGPPACWPAPLPTLTRVSRQASDRRRRR